MVNQKYISSLLLGVALTVSHVAFADPLNGARVGAQAGLVSVNGLGSTLGVGGYSEIEILDGLSIRPGLDYWQKTTSANLGFADVDSTVSDLAIGGALKYAFRLSDSALQPYVLGGLSIHRINAEVNSHSDVYEGVSVRNEASEFKLGFSLGGGLAYPISTDLHITGEFMMHNVETADHLSFMSGLSYPL